MLEPDASVLIVGAGPVGLCMALELGRRGIDCLLVEQSDSHGLLPRASGLSARTMEFCRRWGVAEEVRNGGFPLNYRLDTIYCTSVTGYELERQSNPPLNQQLPLPFSPENKHRLPQHMFDPVIERAARRCREVEIRRRHRLIGFQEVDDGVICRLQPLTEPAAYDFNSSARSIKRSFASSFCEDGLAVRARYMVACDGVNSGVRTALGIDVEGTGSDGSSVIGYSVSALVTIPSLSRYHDKGDAERFIFVGVEGIWGNLTTVDGLDRWRLTLAGTTEKLDLSVIDIAEQVRRCLGRDDIAFEIDVVTPWRRRQMVACRLSSGRVFLAGDAAHAMSPTGGFGMNTGLGDVFDLGWKLDAVLRGWGGPSLLDTYAVERGPVAWRNTKAAAGNFQPWKLQLDFTRIDAATPEGRSDRASVGPEIKAAFAGEWDSWGTALGYRYDESPICIPDGTEAPPDSLVSYTQTARPGARAPHAFLNDGRSTLDLFGHGFTLLCFGEDGDKAEEWRQAAAARTMPFSVIDIDEPTVATLYERRFVLVRPDGHVAWRSDVQPLDVGMILDRVRGAPVSSPRARTLAKELETPIYGQ